MAASERRQHAEEEPATSDSKESGSGTDVPDSRRTEPHLLKPKAPEPLAIQEPPTDLQKAEVSLGGPIPRSDPDESGVRSGDLYVRLEGRIYGPFRPDRLEMLLESGTLTGLETASVDLNRWTPLAYHPRIVRGRIRDLARVHEVLTEMSTLPARKRNPKHVPSRPELGPPNAAVLRKPKRRKSRKKSEHAIPADE